MLRLNKHLYKIHADRDFCRFFFFQAEDGIRDLTVTGVQTCALPISEGKDDPRVREAAALLARSGFDVAVPAIPGLTRGRLRSDDVAPVVATLAARPEIGRASCRERV